MSADLLAEFGYKAPSRQSPGTQRQSPLRSQSGSLIPDLEPVQHVPRRAHPVDSGFRPPTLPSSSTFFREHSHHEPTPCDNGHDVLFDATLESISDNESEDWGEFESADPAASQASARAPPPPPPQHHKDVIHPIQRSTTQVDDFTTITNQVELLDSLSIQEKIPVPGQPKISRAGNSHRPMDRPLTSAPSKPIAPDDPFEEWGDFIDGSSSDTPVAERPQKSLPKMAPIRSTSKSNVSKEASSFAIAGDAVPAAHVRPTNIPPPSILLELFPQLFEQLRQDAMNARKNLHEEGNVDHVASLISYALKAAARVVAGRTLRWKRDTILSQSMKIGPARSGKAGGMKLNTVNKNEDIKEQQEASDVITMWRDRAALFNSVIQASGRRPVHIISESTRAVTATPAQGAIKANHACALCGLKRDERLPRFDECVEDSFGEWWTDHWGHTDCRQFWERNTNLLHQR